MSKQSNPTLIGAFVVGAVTLLAIAVVLFGGSELLARKSLLTTYIDGSVQGLRVGSNVVFRGVRVGFVRNISLLTDIDTFQTTIEVVMELLPETMVVMRNGQPIGANLRDLVSVEQLREAGLSAQLGVESFVTGQLLIDLDYRPNHNGKLRGENPPYPEVPSVPSDIQQVLERVQTWLADLQENIDFRDLGKRLDSILKGLDELSNSSDVRQSLAGVNALINSDDTQQLTADLRAAMTDLRSAIDEVRLLVRNTDDNLEPLLTALQPVVARLDATLGAAESTLGAAEKQIGGDTELSYQVNDTLQEVKDAARSLRIMLDYLQQHPEALIRGK